MAKCSNFILRSKFKESDVRCSNFKTSPSCFTESTSLTFIESLNRFQVSSKLATFTPGAVKESETPRDSETGTVRGLRSRGVSGRANETFALKEGPGTGRTGKGPRAGTEAGMGIEIGPRTGSREARAGAEGAGAGVGQARVVEDGAADRLERRDKTREGRGAGAMGLNADALKGIGVRGRVWKATGFGTLKGKGADGLGTEAEAEAEAEAKAEAETEAAVVTAGGTEVIVDETNAEAENEAGVEAGTKTGTENGIEAEGAEDSEVDVDGLAEPDVTVQLGLGLLGVEGVRPLNAGLVGRNPLKDDSIADRVEWRRGGGCPLPRPEQWPSLHPPTPSVLTGVTGPIALVGRTCPAGPSYRTLYDPNEA